MESYIKKILNELEKSQEELDEMNVTSNMDGGEGPPKTPFAFGKGRAKDKKKTNGMMNIAMVIKNTLLENNDNKKKIVVKNNISLNIVAKPNKTDVDLFISSILFANLVGFS